MLKEKTTWIGIFAAIIIAGLTVAVIIGKLSGTEYAAALGGVGSITGVLLGIFTSDRKKDAQ